MELSTILAIATVFLIVAHFLVKRASLDLPGPSFRDYLPGGLANKPLSDPTSTTAAIVDLARVHGDVFQIWLGPKRAIIVTSPADISHVVSSSADFVRPPGVIAAFEAAMPGCIFTMQPDEHPNTRLKLRDSFNHALLPSFHAPMTDAVREIVAELRAAAAPATGAGAGAGAAPAPTDVNNVLSTVTTRIILNVALGGNMALAERKEFAREIDNLFAEMLNELIAYPLRGLLQFAGARAGLLRSRRSVDALARQLVKRRLVESDAERAARPRDLLDAIVGLDAHDTGRLVAQVAAFVAAGAHTSSIALAWALFHLSGDARARAALEAEVDGVVGGRGRDAPLVQADVPRLRYARQVWKETLRLTPPVPAILRTAARDVTLRGSGTRVPKGARVDAVNFVPQTSGRYFRDPLKFEPERWGATADAPGEADRAPAGAFMPFGAGMRACVGQFLANYEGPLVLAELVRHFRFELACRPEEIRSVTGFIEVPKWSSKRDGVLDMGVPMIVRER